MSDAAIEIHGRLDYWLRELRNTRSRELVKEVVEACNEDLNLTWETLTLEEQRELSPEMLRRLASLKAEAVAAVTMHTELARVIQLSREDG